MDQQEPIKAPADGGGADPQRVPEDEYGADKIKVLEGQEAVRTRPAMYIGSTSVEGLHHLLYEVVDNSVDEALNGYCDRIDVTIHIDNSITVIDNGRGILVHFHEHAMSGISPPASPAG